MQFSIGKRARPGDMYLVDVGKLVLVLAVSPTDAGSLALLAARSANDVEAVYRMSPSGEVVEAITA